MQGVRLAPRLYQAAPVAIKHVSQRASPQLQTLQGTVSAQAAQITALEAKSLGNYWNDEAALYWWAVGDNGPGLMMSFQGSTPSRCKTLNVTSVGNGLSHSETQLTTTHNLQLTSWL